MTPLDTTIFEMILRGWTYKRVAADLGVSRDKVEDVAMRLKLYYDQPSVPALIAYLYENGLISNYRYVGGEVPGMAYYLKLKETV